MCAWAHVSVFACVCMHGVVYVCVGVCACMLVCVCVSGGGGGNGEKEVCMNVCASVRV